VNLSRASVKAKFAPGDVVVLISSPSIEYVVEELFATLSAGQAYLLQFEDDDNRVTAAYESELELAAVVNTPLWKALR